MTALNKQALREAAEKASTDSHTQDEWFHYLRCSHPTTVLALLDELEAAGNRIAELEARTVTLPDRKSELFWPGYGFEFDNLGYVIAVKDAIHAAGIGVKGE